MTYWLAVMIQKVHPLFWIYIYIYTHTHTHVNVDSLSIWNTAVGCWCTSTKLQSSHLSSQYLLKPQHATVFYCAVTTNKSNEAHCGQYNRKEANRQTFDAPSSWTCAWEEGVYRKYWKYYLLQGFSLSSFRWQVICVLYIRSEF